MNRYKEAEELYEETMKNLNAPKEDDEAAARKAARMFCSVFHEIQTNIA